MHGIIYVNPGNSHSTLKTTVPYMQVVVKDLLAFFSLSTLVGIGNKYRSDARAEIAFPGLYPINSGKFPQLKSNRPMKNAVTNMLVANIHVIYQVSSDLFTEKSLKEAMAPKCTLC
jgi:hypothetical protein